MNKILLPVLILFALNIYSEPADLLFSDMFNALDSLENYSMNYLQNIYADQDIETFYFKFFENTALNVKRVEISNIQSRNIVIMRNDTVIMIEPAARVYRFENTDSDVVAQYLNADVFESLRILEYLDSEKEKTQAIDKDGNTVIRYALDGTDDNFTVSSILVRVNSEKHVDMMEAYTGAGSIVMQSVFSVYEDNIPHLIKTQTEFGDVMYTEEIRIIDIDYNAQLPDSLFYPDISGFSFEN